MGGVGLVGLVDTVVAYINTLTRRPFLLLREEAERRLGKGGNGKWGHGNGVMCIRLEKGWRSAVSEI